MAQISSQKEASDNKLSGWIKPAVVLSFVAGIVFPMLNVRFGSTSVQLAAVIAVIDVVLFFATYSIFRNIKPKPTEGSLGALITSALISLPVFILAFIGLGFQISVMTDIVAMYIFGVWIGTAEAAEKYLQHEE